MNRFSNICIFLFLFVCSIPLHAAKIDSIDVRSDAMNVVYKAGVVLPDSYAKSKALYPVLYLLHGGYGHYNDWLMKTPDKTLIQKLADQHNMIIVTPEGQAFGYYLDSKVDKTNQFETYITREVMQKIDATYRTIKDRKGRVITGLSMGGYGSLYISGRHPDLFCAAGSMSGALNPDLSRWNAGERTPMIKERFEKILGPIETNASAYAEASVLNLADKMKINQVALIFDCGVDDFLIEPNRELHRRLLFNSTPHDYSERPGAHTWDYWQNSLPNHLLFFVNVLRANGALPVR